MVLKVEREHRVIFLFNNFTIGYPGIDGRPGNDGL
jgi:hypothetical protein